MVQGAIAGGPGSADATPVQPPTDQNQPIATGTPPPPPPSGNGLDFQKFRDETVKKFDEAFSSYLQGMMASAQKTMQDYQQAFLDTLTKKKDGPAAITDKNGDKLPPPPKTDEWAGNPPGGKGGSDKDSASQAA